MSSVNPLIVLPGAMRERGEAIAAGLHGSITLGAGQFCTKPGLIFVRDDEATNLLIDRLSALIGNPQSYTLLNRSIHEAYTAGAARLDGSAAITSLARASQDPEASGCQTAAALYRTTAVALRENRSLQDEVFGPAAVVVVWSTKADLLDALHALEGQLTASIHANDQDLADFSDLIPILETRAGRLVFNGFPTGVEVCHAMVHGGPWPSTSDGRTTSVGTRAILRFTRQVCFQGFPEASLPPELRRDNPAGIQRLVDGALTRDSF